MRRREKSIEGARVARRPSRWLLVPALAAVVFVLAPIGWTAVTAAVMFALAAGKARTGAALGNPVLQTEARVTLVDGILAAAVIAGIVVCALECFRHEKAAAVFVSPN